MDASRVTCLILAVCVHGPCGFIRGGASERAPDSERPPSVTIAVLTLFHPRELQFLPRHGPPIPLHAGDEIHGAPDLTLRIPGRIERSYRGSLKLYEQGGELIPVLTTDLETAVASIVAAESPPGAPPASLEAQAIVARSYLTAAAKRHSRSDFCDTTHCQFLREPPPSGSDARRAAAATSGLVLLYEGQPIEALYSAGCGGRTRTLAEARLAAGNYPYFAVDCPVRDGVVSGHRIGLCQRGAAAMGRKGATWRDILRLFYPGAAVGSRR